MKIEFATLEDALPILAILKENLIDFNNQDAAEASSRKGFLVRNIEKEEIDKVISDHKNSIALVAKEQDEILGYLLATRLEQLSEILKKGILPCLSEKQIKSLDKIIYYRQIAVKPGVKNIGRALIGRFLQEAFLRGYESVICRIIHEPVNNQRSISFHQKFGFSLIDTIAENSLVAGVYIRETHGVI
ncbi:MAG: Acetyltransferase domain [Rickettsiaceae bacterium]|jgi:predicted N-acetyltransferase YhbS|nr:Acetyltransferase domain [Rickettsiaceae bacterium]